MKPTQPHRFANRAGGEGGHKEVGPPCKLIDVGNAKRYTELPALTRHRGAKYTNQGANK